MGRKMGSDMGSTIVMAVADGNQVCTGHVGDSRAYLINDQGIRALTTDHSLVERLIDTGQITREEARHHPQRNVIYRTMGDKPKLEVETAVHNFSQGDHLLLCSDGLNGMVTDEVIRQIVMEASSSPQDACDRLIQAANAAGGDDNITVVVLAFI
jgi:protein phosphatase